MAYSGTGGPPGSITYVLPGDSAATIQGKLNAVQAGDSLVFTGGATYDFGGATITGKSGVTVWADGPVTIQNAPGAGTHGAFDFSGQSGWTIGGKAAGQGFVFNGSLVDATNAGGNWAVGNCQFNNQQSSGFDGSAIRMNGASFGTIVNNDFTNVGGNVLGMYNLTNIAIDGNHFTNCFEPISIQEPTGGNTALGHDIVIQRNVFLGTQRAAIEIGPSSGGAEYFSGLVVDHNYFDAFNNTAGGGTLLAISLVGQSAQNTTVTNNFIRRGPADAGDVGVAIEMTGTGVVSGNTIVNFSYPTLTYQSGWNVHDNTVYNDGSSPYFGFVNNGSGTGSFGAETVLGGSAATPAMPDRVSWGGTVGTTSGASPVVTLGLSGDTGASATDKITSSAAVKGTADAGSVVHFTIDGVAMAATATAGAGGAWSFTPTGLADGSHTLVASETNAAGKTGSASLAFTLDTKAPVPAVTAAAFAGGTVVVSGTSEAGSRVTLKDNGSAIGTAVAGSDGKWSWTGTADAAAAHAYGASATDLAGNVGSSTTSFLTAGSSPSPSTTVGLASDTGSSSSDRISSSAALSGTAAAGAVVHFTIDGKAIVATATASTSGAWSFSPSGLADGSHTVQAATGTSGATLGFTLDTKAPAPTIGAAAFAGGKVTLSGTSEAGSSVSVYEGLTRIGTATAGSDGKWSMVGSGDAGTYHSYGAVATDAAGNVGASAGDFVPGLTAPAPVVTARLASDPGSSASDRITASARLTGTADPGAVVHFTLDGKALSATATAASTGAWSFAPTGLADGRHTLVASETNASGLTGSTSLAFTLDTKAPAPAIGAATFAPGTVTLTGTSEAGSAVTVYEGLTRVGVATAGSDGHWSMVGAADAGAYHAYGASAVDRAGNVGTSTSDFVPALAAPPPLAPAVPTPALTAALANDTGSSPTDHVSASAVLTGTADPGAVVHFTLDGQALAATAVASSSGAWSLAPSGLADGSHSIVASATNAAGLTSSALLDFTLDTKAMVPAISGVTQVGSMATLTGRTGGTAGEHVAVYDGDTWLAMVTTGSGGCFAAGVAASSDAPHAYGVVVTDLAGNVGRTPGQALLGSSAADGLIGGSARDILQGGGGADVLTGGAGKDVFAYRSTAESSAAAPDRITDFVHGVDKIDFTKIVGIDASGGLPQFQGPLASTGNAVLGAHSVGVIEAGANTLVLVNTSDQAETVSATDSHAADMKIVLTGVHLGLTASDFHHA